MRERESERERERERWGEGKRGGGRMGGRGRERKGRERAIITTISFSLPRKTNGANIQQRVKGSSEIINIFF